MTPRVLSFGGNSFSRSWVSGEITLSSMPPVCYVVSSPSDFNRDAWPVVKRTEAGLVRFEEPLWDCSDHELGAGHGLCLGGVKTFE